MPGLHRKPGFNQLLRFSYVYYRKERKKRAKNRNNDKGPSESNNQELKKEETVSINQELEYTEETSANRQGLNLGETILSDQLLENRTKWFQEETNLRWIANRANAMTKLRKTKLFKVIKNWTEELKWTHKLSTETGINYQELNKLLKADESVRWCHQVLAIKVCISKYQELKKSIRIHVPLSWINLLSVFLHYSWLTSMEDQG